MAAKREAFCTGIRQLGVLSKTNYRSIDKGFKPGSDIFHASAITLPDATDCYISTIKGERTIVAHSPHGWKHWPPKLAG